MPIKGQILTKEAIIQMKESKRKRLLSKYNWIIAEPYLYECVKNGSVKRTNRYITLGEFKEYVLKGLSNKEMQKMGISRKIIQFFSNFCQGKINLTKDEFIKDYEAGMSLDDISKKYGVTREDLTYLRQLYNIKRKGATYIYRKKTEAPLTQRQKEILYGSLMGDAKRQHTCSFSSAGFGQSSKQENYLRWKFIEFENICSKKSLKFYPSNDGRREYQNHKGMWKFYTLANSDVESILKEFYKSGKKRITQEILDNLTPLSIAVWHMDDGTTHFRTGCAPEVKLCTDSFTPEENQLICDWFKERYDINAHVRAKRNRVIINADSVDKLFSLIESYIIPSMRYKIGKK